MKVREDWKLRNPGGFEGVLWEMGVDEYEDLGKRGMLKRFYVDRVIVGDIEMIIKTSCNDADSAPSPPYYRFNMIKRTVGLLGLQNRTDTEGGLPCR